MKLYCQRKWNDFVIMQGIFKLTKHNIFLPVDFVMTLDAAAFDMGVADFSERESEIIKM